LEALARLRFSDIAVSRISSFYRTPAWGVEEQEDFINAVCEVRFSGSAEKLLEIGLDIEDKMGRLRQKKWGPRLIDIDILEFNRQQIGLPHLQIPHPYYTQRAFVLVPFAELEPAWIPTGHTQTLSEILGRTRHAK